MANEYGYEAGGSVMGGLGQLLSMYRDQQKEEQQKAAVPFLNNALAGYLHGNQLPNFAALAPFVSASQGLSESGANTARAGDLNAEANRTSSMLPGELQAQGNANQFAQDTMQQRETNLGNEGAETASRANLNQSEADQNTARLPFVGPEASASLGKVLADTDETAGRTNYMANQSAMMQPEFGLKQQALQYDENPESPENLNRLATMHESMSRARNYDAESNMYGQGQPGVQQADPRMKAFADALAQHTAQTGQQQNPGDLGGGYSIPGMVQGPEIDPQTKLKLLMQHVMGANGANLGGNLQLGPQ